MAVSVSKAWRRFAKLLNVDFTEDAEGTEKGRCA